MLTDEHVRDRVVVVFDVLRATTPIAAALAAGAEQIRVFDSLDAARSAAAAFAGDKLLCGELKCLPPPGFDLGNSPGTYLRDRVAGKTIFLSTTNGTRALVAARRASVLLTAALVNAAAIAKTLATLNRDVTLLCAGTDGETAPEDFAGAGAVVSELPARPSIELTEMARSAKDRFAPFRASGSDRNALVEFLTATHGGRNVVRAGLSQDVHFAAQLNAFDVSPRCDVDSMTVRTMVTS